MFFHLQLVIFLMIAEPKLRGWSWGIQERRTVESIRTEKEERKTGSGQKIQKFLFKIVSGKSEHI